MSTEVWGPRSTQHKEFTIHKTRVWQIPGTNSPKILIVASSILWASFSQVLLYSQKQMWKLTAYRSNFAMQIAASADDKTKFPFCSNYISVSTKVWNTVSDTNNDLKLATANPHVCMSIIDVPFMTGYHEHFAPNTR